MYFKIFKLLLILWSKKNSPKRVNFLGIISDFSKILISNLLLKNKSLKSLDHLPRGILSFYEP